MKINIVVMYEDVEIINPNNGDIEYVTKTTNINAYGSAQDAKFEAKCLKDDNDLDYVTYDVEVVELY